MDYSKPTLYIVSGPPGAGKSTFGKILLPNTARGLEIFNGDMQIIKTATEFHLQGMDKDFIEKTTGPLVDDQLRDLITQTIVKGKNFALETPLANPHSWKFIDPFKQHGYQIHLSYLCLDSVRDCQARVFQREKKGGVIIPPEATAGVYKYNLHNINNRVDYFDAIHLCDGMQCPTILAKIENGKVMSARPEALAKEWITQGLPKLAKKIEQYLPALKNSKQQRM